MNEVTNKNFGDLQHRLKAALNEASFIAIDAEFSGINSEENLKLSLFDSLSHRYENLRKTIQPFIIVQLGIAVFQHNLNGNEYNAECFNVYLFPKSLPFKNRQLTWQVTALEFLQKHNFKFEDFINDGISFLDEIEEELLRKYLEEGILSNNVEHLSYENGEDFKDCVSKISDWFAKEQSSIVLTLEAANPTLQYMLQKKIRNNFNNVWTISGEKTIDVIKVSDDIYNVLKSEQTCNLEEALLQSYIGFSAIFKLLSSSKKPIIGHNLLLDLMFLHQQFYKPLPGLYEEFKNNIHALFPQIYDTKFLSLELRKLFSKDEVKWKINSLSCLHEYFTSLKGRNITFNSPKVHLNAELPKKNNYHNAVWDAYFSGYIFIKMTHIFCVKKFGPGLEERAPTWSELLSSVKQFVNHINISRGNEIYMKIDGADPPSSRPEWLHVKLNAPYVDINQVHRDSSVRRNLLEKFSYFGPVDIMPHTRKRVLVAVANHRSAQHILQHFENSREFHVARYSRIRHATPTTLCLWSGFILSGGMLVWMLKKCC